MGIADDFRVIEELQKLTKTDFDKADSVFFGFKSGANHDQMLDYWHAPNAKEKAKIIKKHWCL